MGKLLLQNKTRKRYYHSATIVFVAVVLYAQSVWCQTGGEAGAYLRAPVGASMIAMGGAQTAAPAYDVSWWNPAQLSLVNRPVFAVGTGLYSLGRTEAFSSFDFKVPPRVGLGLSALYRGDPSINNLVDINEDPIPTGAFTTLTFKFALSYLLTRRFSAGLSMGVFYQSLPTANFGDSLGYSDATSVTGFTIGTQYKLTDSITVAFVIRDIDPLQLLSGKAASIGMNWQISSPNTYNATVTDLILPTFVLGGVMRHQLQGYPLQIHCDINGYLVDGTFTKLDYPLARVNIGTQWDRWKTFRLRAGLSDITFNRSIFATGDDNVDYWRDFSMGIAAGFGWDVTLFRKKMSVNYSLTTDKVWAGLNQMLDVVSVF